MHHRCGDQLGLNKNRFEESSPKRIRLADEYSKRVIRRQSTIFDLPVEVLARIFEYLLVRERGNVRLVCRRWCEIFDETAKLVEGEKLICCDLYRTTDPSQDILRTLARSKRAILNIEFHYFEFRESDSTFWQQCGPKIRALHFSECSMSADTLARVVLHCPNLTHISWCVENVKKEKMAFCPAETMDRLLSYRVTNANLISLGIRCVRACGLSNFILGALFALFPNIKKLAFCFTAFERSDDQDEDVDEESVAGSRTRLTIGYVLRQIAALENVAERLDVALKYRHDRRNVSWDRIVSTCEFGRLRQVTLDVASENAQLNTVFAFLANQPCLEAVRLRGIPASPEPSFSESCAHMLDRCPKLRHLRVESRALSLSGAWLLRIVESRLTTLCVRTAKLRIDPEFRCRPGSQCRVNTRLRTLVLDGDVGETAQLAFVDTFRRLHTLELHAVTDKVLQSVCKYQVELVSLKLWRACYTTDYGFTGIRSGGNVETIASGGETIYSARRLQSSYSIIRRGCVRMRIYLLCVINTNTYMYEQ